MCALSVLLTTSDRAFSMGSAMSHAITQKHRGLEKILTQKQGEKTKPALKWLQFLADTSQELHKGLGYSDILLLIKGNKSKIMGCQGSTCLKAIQISSQFISFRTYFQEILSSFFSFLEILGESNDTVSDVKEGNLFMKSGNEQN